MYNATLNVLLIWRCPIPTPCSQILQWCTSLLYLPASLPLYDIRTEKQYRHLENALETCTAWELKMSILSQVCPRHSAPRLRNPKLWSTQGLGFATCGCSTQQSYFFNVCVAKLSQNIHVHTHFYAHPSSYFQQYTGAGLGEMLYCRTRISSRVFFL